MDPLKRRALQQLTVELVNNMNPDQLRPHLFQKCLLTRDEQERVSLPVMTTMDKNMFILQRIPSKGSDAFDLFVECLQETVEAVPAHQQLVEGLFVKLEQLRDSRGPAVGPARERGRHRHS